MNSIYIINGLLIFWIVFSFGFEAATHNQLKFLISNWRINLFLSWSGLWHSWSMFAPQPLHSNRNIFAKIVDPNGKLLSIYNEPNWGKMNFGERGNNSYSWFWGAWLGKYEMFRNMKERKFWSSVGEARQWDMPLMMRALCRFIEMEQNKKGIYGDSIALYMDIDYSPYFCPKDGLKDWKTNRDVLEHLIYVYECINTTGENVTLSDPEKDDAEVIQLPDDIEMNWERPTEGAANEREWKSSYIEKDGTEVPIATGLQPYTKMVSGSSNPSDQVAIVPGNPHPGETTVGVDNQWVVEENGEDNQWVVEENKEKTHYDTPPGAQQDGGGL